MEEMKSITFSNTLMDFLYKTLSRSKMTSKLITVANKLGKSDKIEDQIANIIIKQQLLEIQMEVILMANKMLIDNALDPIVKKDKKRKTLTFGAFINELEIETVEFPDKPSVIESLQKINSIRIQIVHKLLDQDEEGIYAINKDANIYFDQCLKLFEKASEWYFTRMDKKV